MTENKKTKILFLIETLAEGGAENVLINLLKYLDYNKYDVTVQTVVNVGIYREQLPEQVHYKTYYKKGYPHLFIPRNKLFNPRRLYKRIIGEKYDICIAYIEGITTRIISGNPFPNTKTYAWVHNEKLDPSIFRTLKEQKQCYESFDKVAFVAKSAFDAFVNLYPDYKINGSVVYNTLAIDKIKQKATEAIDLVPNKNVINMISVGRLMPQKSYLRLIDVFYRLKCEGIVNWHFYLLGKGFEQKDIENKIETYELEDFVTLLGFDSNPHKYVSKMDLFVCSSLHEGYSTAVTESIINGIPVITTSCSGMDEIIGDTNAGHIVENSEEGLYQGLKKILLNELSLPQMKEAADLRSEFFSTARTVKQFLDFISD